MNEVARDIKNGMAIIRKEGINFSTFKARLLALLTPTPRWDDDDVIFYYESYCICRAKFSDHPETVEQWAADHFQNFKKGETGFELKQRVQ